MFRVSGIECIKGGVLSSALEGELLGEGVGAIVPLINKFQFINKWERLVIKYSISIKNY